MKTLTEKEVSPEILLLIDKKDNEIRRLKNEIAYLQSDEMILQRDDLVIHLNNQQHIICRFDQRSQADSILTRIFSAGNKEIIKIQDLSSVYLIKVGCIEYAYIA